MTTSTIPKILAQKGDFILLARTEYQSLLRGRKIVPVVSLSAKEKRDLEKARAEMSRGDYLTLEELEHDLDNPRAREGRKRNSKIS